SQADPRSIARRLMAKYKMSSADFDCVDRLWSGESGWNVHANNPSSSAYGIPQALPGSKMASAGPNWQDNAETQIRWGLGYIENRYGTACSAWSFKQGHGWY
ncbi:MAG: lytic transglycosylase domain-containing protein, partial [Marmoricola sp.]